jgi:hypothetical protein
MAVDVEAKRWRSGEVAKIAGIQLRQLRAWRELHGLFPWAAAGKEGNRYSVVDTCIVVAIAIVCDAGFTVGGAVEWIGTKLPYHFKNIANLRLNHGAWSGVTAPMWQRTSACAVAGTLDLDAVVNKVIVGLKLPTPIFDKPPPKLQTALAVVERTRKYVDGPAFAARCAVFVKGVLARKPPATTLAEISVSLGVPQWIITMGDEQHQAWPIAERVRGEMRGVVLQ